MYLAIFVPDVLQCINKSSDDDDDDDDDDDVKCSRVTVENLTLSLPLNYGRMIIKNAGDWWMPMDQLKKPKA